jgi:ADP-L-glycero-D-manno-heptose 6-epimerase
MTANSAKKRTLLVTGAAGFIGSNFVRQASDRGYSIVSVDAPAHFGDRPELATTPFGTIVDREELMDWLNREKPEFSGVIHLGACTDTMELDETYLRRWNLEYSRNLWNWCSGNRVPFVYASSAATYGEGELGYSDDEERIPSLKPLNPYGESKRLFDLEALASERKGVAPPAWAGFKFFNVYGFGERHKGKMASVVLHSYDQIATTGGVKLFRSHREGIADGDQKRDFIHVDDVVDALLFALEKPIRRGIFNLGTGTARSFLDLARAVFRALGRQERIAFIDTPEALRARYQYFTQAEMNRLRSEGWSRDFLSLEEGVSRTVAALRGRS